MVDTFMGQILPTGFDFAMKNFALCNGQILSISQNQALFSLLGTTYGGNGVNTYALPDLRGRVPVGSGPSADPSWSPQTVVLGQITGNETVTLIQAQMPSHTHSFLASSQAGTTNQPANSFAASNTNAYGAAQSMVPLGGGPLAQTGGSQPHSNLQPLQVISFNICLFGIFPSRN